MSNIKRVFNTILFQYHKSTIRVREVIIFVLIMIFLLFFGLTQCTNSEYLKRVEALENTCGFTKDNLNTLQNLLDRGDLCSDPWMEDYQDYIERIEEQNDLLENMDSKEDKEIYKIQKKLVSAMEKFYESQSKDNLEDLEDITKEYQKLYQKNCKGKGV